MKQFFCSKYAIGSFVLLAGMAIGGYSLWNGNRWLIAFSLLFAGLAALLWLYSCRMPIFNSAAGPVQFLLGISEAVSGRRRAERALEWQRRFFEQLATGAPLGDLLDILTKTVESQIAGGLCSILILDEEQRHLHHGAAPLLPQAYVQAIDGAAIGPNAGSCGAAAYRGELVIVDNIASDPLWAEYRDIALAHGLRACWSAPFCDSQGRVLGALAVYYRAPRPPSDADIEEIKQAAYLAAVAVERTRVEAALRSSEQRYRLVSRATNDVIWDWDIINGRLEWNECAQTLFGYTADQVGAYPLWWDEHLHPDDRERASAGVLAVIESGQQFWSGEYRFRRADQTYAHVLDRGYVIRDDHGAPLRMIGAMQDITERYRAEQALREREEAARDFQERLKTLHSLSIELSAANSFDDLCRLAVELGRDRLGFDRLALWFLDEDPRYMLGSFGTDESGQTRDERSVRKLVDAADLASDTYYGNLQGYFQDQVNLYNYKHEVVGQGWNAIAPLWDCDRVIGYISADNLLGKLPVSPYQMELLMLYGSTLGHLFVRKRTELDLERHIAERTTQLEAANKELEAFSYSVSHDLRAPLRHIDGFARLLAQREGDRLDPTSARYLRVIGEAARKMGQLIDDLLAFSRMSRTEMQMLPVDLGQVVGDVRHDLAPMAEGRSIEWRIEPLPVICGDPAMINVVLSNLLSNAVKYTAPRERARIAVGAAAEDADEVVISVSDNGVGFDMAYAHKLFGVFQRLHRDEEFEGTGIGLATVRRIISRHGGRVWAVAAPEGGATFYMTLKRHRSGNTDEKNPAG
jgi:PAS domain S-box-containing protein